jgi:hypothetical protein
MRLTGFRFHRGIIADGFVGCVNHVGNESQVGNFGVGRRGDAVGFEVVVRNVACPEAGPSRTAIAVLLSPSAAAGTMRERIGRAFALSGRRGRDTNSECSSSVRVAGV